VASDEFATESLEHLSKFLGQVKGRCDIICEAEIVPSVGFHTLPPSHLSLATRHSYRNASIGSNFAARRAGSQQAIKAVAINSPIADVSVNGSQAEMP
jgi:hypothetical protein